MPVWCKIEDDENRFIYILRLHQVEKNDRNGEYNIICFMCLCLSTVSPPHINLVDTLQKHMHNYECMNKKIVQFTEQSII